MKRKRALMRLKNASKLDLISNFLIVLFCLFSIFPIYWLFIGSFKFSTDIIKIPPDWIPNPWTLENYKSVFASQPALNWIANSVIISFGTAVGIVLVSASAGFALSKMQFRGKKILFSFVIASLLIPMEIYILPLYKLIVSIGWKGTLWGYIVPNLALPFGVYLMKNFFDTIPDEIIEAARIDGCGTTRFFFQFGLPLAKPGIGALVIMSVIRIWNNYLWQLLNATNDPKSYTLPVGITKLFENQVEIDYGLKFAAAVLTALPLLIVFFAFQKYFTKGISAGAVKG
ncbi:MAG TPA: carbohydrate ABC transporter permease [Eubacteriales bacterium]|nr:carbohydrate ABC transporter permease [Eubacteriales bacterium]